MMKPLDINAIPQGVEIIATSTVFDKMEWRQYRFPKSKKRRIRAKWAKKRRNYKYFLVAYTAIKVQNQVYVTEKGYKYLSENMKSSQ